MESTIRTVTHIEPITTFETSRGRISVSLIGLELLQELYLVRKGVGLCVTFPGGYQCLAETFRFRTPRPSALEAERASNELLSNGLVRLESRPDGALAFSLTNTGMECWRLWREPADTMLHKLFRPVKEWLPNWISDPIRRFSTAILTPLRFSFQSGHCRSSFRRAAVNARGEPIPWYTYPCIDFLRTRSYEGRKVLEFGGGQSTYWWAGRARHVVTFEADRSWYERLKETLPSNVELFFVPMDNEAECVAEINGILDSRNHGPFDVIVIDGLFRWEMIGIARRVMTDSGAIICDDADGYWFFEAFRQSGLNRADFFGYQPGVLLPHCTSILFGASSFLFDSRWPIPVMGMA